MYKLILITLIIHYIGFFINRKKKNNILCCGIFGWVGKNPLKFNKNKFNILGIFNDERGGHSCGVYHNGKITVGIDKLKYYQKLISNGIEINPGKEPVVIGHTRYATGGAHNTYNAHPFGFGHNNEDHLNYKFVGVHNGTIVNKGRDLAKEFNINIKSPIRHTKNSITNREKIDSEILLESIYRDKSFKPLESYNGAAALIFYDLSKPNVCYFYHGKSYQDNWDQERSLEKNIKEERPLFYYQETRNSLYVSSLKSSLIAIGGTEETIGMFDHNTVYKVTDGNLKTAELTKIDRSNKYQKEWTNYYTNNYTPPKKHQYPSQNKLSLPVKTNNNLNIHQEKTKKNQNEYKGVPYFNKFRWWRNGKIISGIYTWISGYGHYFLGFNENDALKEYNNCCNKFFLGKNFVPNNVTVPKKDRFKPITKKYSSVKDIPNFHYFVEGMRCKKLEDYKILSDKSNAEYFTVRQISECVTHPIISLNNNINPNDQNIFRDGSLFTGTFYELGAERTYTVSNGNLTNYKEIKVYSKIEKKETKVIDINDASLNELMDDNIEIVNTNTDDIVEEELFTIFQETIDGLNDKLLEIKEYKSISPLAENLEIELNDAINLLLQKN